MRYCPGPPSKNELHPRVTQRIRPCSSDSIGFKRIMDTLKRLWWTYNHQAEIASALKKCEMARDQACFFSELLRERSESLVDKLRNYKPPDSMSLSHWSSFNDDIDENIGELWFRYGDIRVNLHRELHALEGQGTRVEYLTHRWNGSRSQLALIWEEHCEKVKDEEKLAGMGALLPEQSDWPE
ncbi:hypothetical protein TWF694_008402 [Orbilia ellipsospora]|uniref:Uncharacterized protein n=1 Tax=Orbilia ellipsospora TaxID=2528407 RepID=A0AAV9XG19_9PEZI